MIAEAIPGEVILVAGKGHENYQEIHGVKHHFDDVEEVRAIYARVLGEPAGRAQKRTMIPKILDRLFNAPF